MKIVRNRVIIAALLVSLMVFPALLVNQNIAIAVVNPPIVFDVFAYVSAVPDPVGVGQTAIITFRVDQPLAGASIRSGLASGITVTVTKPDNKTETKGPFTLDSTSSGWMYYTPNQVGTYYFQMHFPQQGPYWVNTTQT